MKKQFSLFLTLLLCLSLLSVPALATGEAATAEDTAATPEKIAEDLVDEIGESDTEKLVDALKTLLDTTRSMTDEELAGEIRSMAAELGIPLNDIQTEMLLDLYRQFEALGESEIAQKIEDMKNTVEKLRELAEKARETKEVVDEYAQKAGGFLSKLKELWDNFVA